MAEYLSVLVGGGGWHPASHLSPSWVPRAFVLVCLGAAHTPPSHLTLLPATKLTRDPRAVPPHGVRRKAKADRLAAKAMGKSRVAPVDTAPAPSAAVEPEHEAMAGYAGKERGAAKNSCSVSLPSPPHPPHPPHTHPTHHIHIHTPHPYTHLCHYRSLPATPPTPTPA